MSNTLKVKLDAVFSIFIRLRDSKDGYVKCYCCGKILPWKESQNMHFIPRQHLSLRFSEINCHAGCIKCNYYDNGNIEQYTLHLKKEYGDDIVERLVLIKNKPNKISDFEYRAMISHYNAAIFKMQTNKK
jgi:hypothetical protein